MHFFLIAAALALSLGLAEAAAATDNTFGEQLFNNSCRTCHSWKRDDNRLCAQQRFFRLFSVNLFLS
jgi:cytochrome c2